MDWYIVIKTIKGRRYYYRQKTWREGKHVRTLSQYIGPAGNDDISAPGITPKPREAAAVDVEAIIEALTDSGSHLGSWDAGWSADRTGEMLVEKKPEVDALIRNLGITHTHSSQGAYYNRETDVLNTPPKTKFEGLPTEDATGVFYSTLLHELVHWTGHASRLGRLNQMDRGGPLYAREELVAELGSVLLMERFGIKPPDISIHATYFQDWLDRTPDPEVALRYAQRQAERAVQFILKRGTMVSHGSNT